MCLTVTIRLEGLSRAETLDVIDLVEGVTQLHVGISRQPMLMSDRPAIHISEDGACGCSLLADDADWNADHWSMVPECLPALTQTIETIVRASPAPVLFDALWAGDVGMTTVEISLAELVQRVRDGRIGTQTSYRVPAGVSQASGKK